MLNLTKSQCLIYETQKVYGGSINNICGSVMLKGIPENVMVSKAIETIIAANDVFTIRLTEEGTVPMQEFGDKVNVVIEHKEFDTKQDMTDFAENVAKKPLNIQQTLCEIYRFNIGKEYFGIIINISHFIGDAWSLSLLCSQFIDLYYTYKAGNVPFIHCGSYKEYIEKEIEYYKSSRYFKARSFWENIIRKHQQTAFLNEQEVSSISSNRKTVIIDKATVKKYKEFCYKHQMSIFELFAMSMSYYISRVSDNVEDFFIGAAILNRFGKLEKETVGMYVNTVPIHVRIDEDKTFLENMLIFSENALEVFKYQKFNYSDIIRMAREYNSETLKMFDVVISYQNAAVTSNVECETKWYSCGMQAETLQFHIDDRDNIGCLTLNYDYQNEKLNEAQIYRIHDSIIKIIDFAIVNQGEKIKNIDILGEDERSLLSKFNDTDVSDPAAQHVIELFEHEAEVHPTQEAIIAEDKILTYGELDELSNRIANALIKKGVQRNDIVAFILPRKSWLFAVMLGILKTGAAYLPIDPDFPKDRIELMLEDSKAKLCVTEDNIDELIYFDDAGSPEIVIDKNSICYCIYTSGSTGRPKGVLVKHNNVLNYIGVNDKNIIFHEIRKNNYRNIVSITTVGFDIFVTESLMAFSNGYTVVLANEEQAKSQRKLNDFLHVYPAEIIQTTPAKISILTADAQYNDYLKAVKIMILGGELLDKALVNKIRKLTKAKIYNAYGPTETTVWSTVAVVENISDNIHIGKPIANTQIYIVDKYMRLLPIGAIGELCIAGNGVSAGYLNRKELTEEKFADNPFGAGKLYKTGDLAYWREDGNIAYVGRKDFQVKIRGLRIELGEIENAICSVDGVSQAVVTVGKDNNEKQYICAFYDGKEIQPNTIRANIANILPKYMLPHVFIHLDTMPMTPNGKINRMALPEVDFHSEVFKTEYVEPVTETQKELCKIVGRLLENDRIGIKDNFSDIGVDSLKAIEFAATAYSKGVIFDIQNVFDYPTIEELGDYIDSENKIFKKYDYEEFDEIHQFISKRMPKAKGVLKNDFYKNVRKDNKRNQDRNIGDIFLTGATGFLGAHILSEYLNNYDGIAYCLVKGNDQTHCEQHIFNILSYYFGKDFYELYSGRIIVMRGDITKVKFGMTEIPDFDMMINVAACVKHYGSYEFFKQNNVDSVENAINIAKFKNAKLIHISTLSVSGIGLTDIFYNQYNSLEEEVYFSEGNLYIGQPLDNVYIRSKFEAEKLIYSEMLNGLKANVIRVGNVTNRASDLLFQKNYAENAFLQRVKALFELGIVPEYMQNIMCEFSPVDDTAKAVMIIAENFNMDSIVFHVSSNREVSLKNICEFADRYNIKLSIVGREEFDNKLAILKDDKNKKNIYDTLIKDINRDGQLDYASNIKIDKKKTMDYLNSVGFSWSEINDEYLNKYIKYFKEIGYLEV